MTVFPPERLQLPNRDAASVYIADEIEKIIQEAVNARGEAIILLSGGNTPRDAYAALAARDLPWEHVTIGLVDDRCVSEDDPGSNQAMIKAIFTLGPACEANIVDLISLNTTGAADIEAAKQRMSALTASPDLCLMGMGLDGHTASWFPDSHGLQDALHIDTPEAISFVDAEGCPGAGVYPHRLTLTLPAVMRARKIILFITGEEKADVFSASASKSVYSAPVKALFSAGPRFHTVWAP